MIGTALLLAIVGHLVGDYLLQNDWMALNKKKPGVEGTFPCCVHAALWTTAVCVLSGWVSPWPVVILFALHYWQDRTNIVALWMDLIGQKQFRTGPCAPWSVIVVDNVWHVVTLVLVWRFAT